MTHSESDQHNYDLQHQDYRDKKAVFDRETVNQIIFTNGQHAFVVVLLRQTCMYMVNLEA